MIPLNNWILENIPRMNHFLEKISTISYSGAFDVTNMEDADLKDLAFLTSMISIITRRQEPLPDDKILYEMIKIVNAIEIKSKQFQSKQETSCI